LLAAAVDALVLATLVPFFAKGAGASDQPPTEPMPTPPADVPALDADIDIEADCASTAPGPNTPIRTVATDRLRLMISPFSGPAGPKYPFSLRDGQESARVPSGIKTTGTSIEPPPAAGWAIVEDGLKVRP
jgi:hypothetical protein